MSVYYPNPKNMSKESYAMNVPSLVELLFTWKNRLALFATLLAFVTALILYITPNQYYSYSSAIPTNAAITDKAYLFNENLNDLHQSIGTYSDLERLYATATLDTAYKFLIEKYDLVKRYNIKAPNHNIGVQKAILMLSDENIRIEKSENGLLRIHIIDFSPDTAAAMANDLMQWVNEVNSTLLLAYNRNSFQKLDSMSVVMSKENNPEIDHVQRLKKQFEIAMRIQQPALRIVEKASPSLKHFKPKRLITFISTMLLGMLSAIALVAIWESIRVQRS
ncbi:MAG: hypothetical protein JNM95_12895 [Chitinophagaceae bacterium]|nr:hypothetical protein [Chitinophagaceae bacterium]